MSNNKPFPNQSNFKRKKRLNTSEYISGILSGNRQVLGQAITLIESTKKEHQEMARKIVDGCMPHSGNSIRIGITGVPGVGKSTFIEAFGSYLTKQENKKLAVLAIDPSSKQSKGSILGDKTRMNELSTDENAFIRPSPSSGTLGGVTLATRETIILCEAAGYNVILIETVGVGQSETEVHSMVDFFLLLMLAGAGDELQGIKRGIMELADLIAINKADGNNIVAAQKAVREYKNALHLFPKTQSGWQPPVEISSSIEKTGMDVIWKQIEAYKKLTITNEYFVNNRKKQAQKWMHQAVSYQLQNDFYSTDEIKEKISQFEQKVQTGEISPSAAAEQLMEIFSNTK